MLSFEEISAKGYREPRGYEIKARKRKELAKIYVEIASTRMDRREIGDNLRSCIQWYENQAYHDGTRAKQNMVCLIQNIGLFDSRIENTPSMGSEKVGN